MPRNYYIFSAGRLKREQNTVYLENTEGVRRPVPVEDVDALYVFGETDLNTKLLVFLSQKKVPLHVFNYFGYYSGTFYPREYLHSGLLLVKQVEHYSDPQKRLELAGELVRGSGHSINRTLAYYRRRKADIAAADETADNEIEDSYLEGEPDEAEGLQPTSEPEEMAEADIEYEQLPPDLPNASAELRAAMDRIADLVDEIEHASSVDELRGIEGNIWENYYGTWRHILREAPGIEFEKRVRRPPNNMVNSLISFGNSMLYTACASEIYRTSLAPEISYLHEPGERRLSLSLDLADIFKPVIVDRLIFTLLNNRQLQQKHFAMQENACYMTEEGRKIFVKAFDEKMRTTLYHRRMKRHVSYKQLLRLECQRLMRHLNGEEQYRSFRAWW